MKLEFLSLLPDCVKSKVDDIEQTIGSEVVVRQGDTASHQGGNSEPPRAICICDHRSGALKVEIVLSAEAVAHNLLHEVLHAHRAAVLGVPRLLRDDASETSLTNALTNDTEHLFIVPEEITLDPAALAFWEAEETRRFEALKARLALTVSDAGELLATRHGLIRQWVFVTRVIKTWSREAELADLLERMSWKADADFLRVKVDAAGDEAAKVLSAYLHAGNLNPDYFALYAWKVGPGGGKEVKGPLPAIDRF